MRIHVGLPKTFCADAVNTTTYLINRVLLVHLDCKMPKEVWSGKKVKISFLKACSLFYVHIDVTAKVD